MSQSTGKHRLPLQKPQPPGVPARKKSIVMSKNIPQWKSNRLAPRTIEVLELHKHKQPAIASYEETLVPAAHLVMDLYGKLQAYSGGSGDARKA